MTPVLCHGVLAVAAAVTGAPPGSVVPIPPSERVLLAIVADRPVPVQGVRKDLEGPVFLPGGDLLFSDVQGRRVMRLDVRGRIAEAFRLERLKPGGMALGPDSRLYIAAANTTGGGAVISVLLDGTQRRTIVPERAGFAPNDVTFDAKGGFYFSDARGSIGKATGGVWYVGPDGAPPKPVIRNLAIANGIALSPDGKQLWVGEFALGRLYRITLKDATTPAPFGATTAYHFTGPAPDSMRIDGMGQLYVAMYGQGRILVFSPSGIPIGQILLPDRDAGRNLNLTSMAIRPGTRDMAIVTSDGEQGGNATVFRARTIER
ncbi:SMP-30/gluconolactonase/LRE family protein [Sphingomonas sp. 2R-10]|uniref:SMP-30/gluconolactonase/LRE family protein n=1 Tax=Sphingomonas sp. 2R-10 TaxID=3045148 RepID=UPI000F7BA5A3|nr:SMP-30/gluconolactonase/LRE family protein [Sphingomonas sp. 2R-10]MDJ0276224.1 SMP-30/gluconolactonase/LRE family protein [Sphingomonas sp. 2R-10]